MPQSEDYIRDVDVDNEPNEQLVAQKITSVIAKSRSDWQDFKNLCTELYFDFLAYKEAIDDKTKSNTFIPQSYVDIQVNKARLKKLITTAKPYARVKPVPFDPALSFRLSHWASHMLDEAEFEKFLDVLIQDALTYPGAIFQVSWGVEHKKLPAYEEIELIPGSGMIIKRPIFEFNEQAGRIERVFLEQEVREGLFLENINIQDFYLPGNSREAETDPWAGKTYSTDLVTLSRAINPDGSPKYMNLSRLGEIGETKRPDTDETARMKQPVKRDYPKEDTFGKTFNVVEFVTDEHIFHVPEGADFLILKEKNPYRRKPYHIARVEQLNGEPFGFCPNRANHLMTRTYNEVWDILMDGAYLEDNKAFIVNEELVDDFEVGAAQGNLIHVKGLDPGVDVATAIKPIETRALATEFFPLIEKMDQIHQLTAARTNMSAGMVQQGAETAYENARLEQGEGHRILDMASNIVNTALKPIYDDLHHLAQINYIKENPIEIMNDQGGLTENLPYGVENPFIVGPSEMYGAKLSYHFEFIGKERSRIEERAAIINLLQVWGNMVNIDPVSILLMKKLLINFDMEDTAKIEEALNQSIQMRLMIQAAEMQTKNQPEKGQSDKQGTVHKSMNVAANAGNSQKRPGV